MSDIRESLARIGVLTADALTDGTADVFDDQVDAAVRAFQQQRGLTVDGKVGPDTYGALQAARRKLGDRTLRDSPGHPYTGDDVADLQRQLLDMGFDLGRVDGIYGPRTAAAVTAFQRESGLKPDGQCGYGTLTALRNARPRSTAGNAHELREDLALRRRGAGLAGKAIVIDAGHGGDDTGWLVGDVCERDIVLDVATRLQGRLQAAGAFAELTRGADTAPDDAARAEFANATDADLLISLHCDGAQSPRCQGVATYYFGTGPERDSRVGARFAGLVQREIVARVPGLLDARTHAKTWSLLRLTRMPAVRVELGYLTHPTDAALLSEPDVRDAIAEALLAAVQRVFLPIDVDHPTGTFKLADLVS